MRFINLSSCLFYVVSAKKSSNTTSLGSKTNWNRIYALESIEKVFMTHLYTTRATALCKFDATNHCCYLVVCYLFVCVVFVFLLYYAYAAVTLIQRSFSYPCSRLIVNFLCDMLCC